MPSVNTQKISAGAARPPESGPTVPATTRGHAIVGVNPPAGSLAVPSTRKQGQTTAEVHKVPPLVRQTSITGDEWHANVEAKAPTGAAH